MIERTAPPNSSAAPPEGVYENPRPYGERRLKDVIKEQIPVETLASDLGAELRRTGKGLRGLCPIHGGRNRDALAVFPEQGRWHCFVCEQGGDVIDLWMQTRNCFDFKLALIDLSGQYGVEPPPRSEGWRRWSVEKGRRHDALRDIRTKLFQRRLLRLYAADLERIEDPAEREEEARALYADLYYLAQSCAEWRADR